jgi:hypothetical protein
MRSRVLLVAEDRDLGAEEGLEERLAWCLEEGEKKGEKSRVRCGQLSARHVHGHLLLLSNYDPTLASYNGAP